MTAYARHSMSKASKERALAKAFKEADKDGSGSLTLDEYLAVFRDQGVNMTREAAAAFFREKDRDLDGQISYEEFLGKMTMTERLWFAMDKDKNGTVSTAEAQAAIKKYRKTIGEGQAGAISKAFADSKDKKMDYEQFCAAMNELKVDGAASSGQGSGGGERKKKTKQ